MKTKKNLSMFILLIMVFSLSSCFSKDDTYVRDEVMMFCEEITHGHYRFLDKFYEQTFRGTENSMFMETVTRYAESNGKKTTFEIQEPVINGDTATVDVNFHYLDASKVFENTMSISINTITTMAEEGRPMSEDFFDRLLIFNFSVESIAIDDTFSDATVTFYLENLDNKWVIVDADEELLDVLYLNIASIVEDYDFE